MELAKCAVRGERKRRGGGGGAALRGKIFL